MRLRNENEVLFKIARWNRANKIRPTRSLYYRNEETNSPYFDEN